MTYHAAGREADAVRELERSVGELDAIAPDFFWLTAVALLAEASARLRHAESATLLYETLAPYADCMIQVGYAGGLGSVARLLGLLAAVRGEHAVAIGHLERALKRTEAGGAELFEPEARSELAQLRAAEARPPAA